VVTPVCPSCAAPVLAVEEESGGYACAEHGRTPALWRAEEASYDVLSEHLQRDGSFPTYLPWPLAPGWSVTDVASICGAEGARGVLTCTTGASELDGAVDVIVVAEEPGTGLGARVAGLEHADPGPGFSAGAPVLRVRVEGRQVALWPVSTSDTTGDWDRSVLCGEHGGRWLWVVVQPASAVLLLREDWTLRDATGIGPALMELPFSGPAPRW